MTAATTVETGNGTRSTSGRFWFDSFTYTLDAEMNAVPVVDVNGWAAAPDISLGVPPDLASASVTGTLQASVAEVASGTWTAQGRRGDFVNTFHTRYPGSTFTGTYSGASRSGTAFVPIAEVGLPSGAAFADITDARSATLSICHVGC